MCSVEFAFKRNWALGSTGFCMSEGKVSGLCLGLSVTGQLMLSQLTNISRVLLKTVRHVVLCTTKVLSSFLIDLWTGNFQTLFKKVNGLSRVLNVCFLVLYFFIFQIFSSFRFWLLSEWRITNDALWVLLSLHWVESLRNIFYESN